MWSREVGAGGGVGQEGGVLSAAPGCWACFFCDCILDPSASGCTLSWAAEWSCPPGTLSSRLSSPLGLPGLSARALPPSLLAPPGTTDAGPHVMSSPSEGTECLAQAPQKSSLSSGHTSSARRCESFFLQGGMGKENDRREISIREHQSRKREERSLTPTPLPHLTGEEHDAQIPLCCSPDTARAWPR